MSNNSASIAAPRLAVVAHAPLASALRAVAAHVLGEAAVLSSGAVFIDVLPDAAPETSTALMTAALAQQAGAQALLILTDLPHATPHNCAAAAAKLAMDNMSDAAVLSGCTAAMVLRAVANGSSAKPLNLEGLLAKLHS